MLLAFAAKMLENVDVSMIYYCGCGCCRTSVSVRFGYARTGTSTGTSTGTAFGPACSWLLTLRGSCSVSAILAALLGPSTPAALSLAALLLVGVTVRDDGDTVHAYQPPKPGQILLANLQAQ